MAAPRAASLDGLTGYAELRFGLSLDEAREMTGADPSEVEGGALLIETKETLIGRPARRQLWFRNGKLSRIAFHWSAEDRADPVGCQALFEQLAGDVSDRYGKPAQGPTEITTSNEFSGGTFWVFHDGANIGLSASNSTAAGGPKSCRAMLSYRAAPVEAPAEASGD